MAQTMSTKNAATLSDNTLKAAKKVVKKPSRKPAKKRRKVKPNGC